MSAPREGKMDPTKEELTPWELAFLDDPGEPRGYQPRGGADVPDEPTEPPSGSAGTSSSSPAARQSGTREE